METFPRYGPFVRGIHRWPVNSPHKGQWRGVLVFSLICAWINGWVNNGEAGGLIRHHAHYDVTVMIKLPFIPDKHIWKCHFIIPSNYMHFSENIVSTNAISQHFFTPLYNSKARDNNRLAEIQFPCTTVSSNSFDKITNLSGNPTEVMFIGNTHAGNRRKMVNSTYGGEYHQIYKPLQLTPKRSVLYIHICICSEWKWCLVVLSWWFGSG